MSAVCLRFNDLPSKYKKKKEKENKKQAVKMALDLGQTK